MYRSVVYKNIFQLMKHQRSQTVFRGTETLGREIFVQRILISTKRFQNMFTIYPIELPS